MFKPITMSVLDQKKFNTQWGRSIYSNYWETNFCMAFQEEIHGKTYWWYFTNGNESYDGLYPLVCIEPRDKRLVSVELISRYVRGKLLDSRVGDVVKYKGRKFKQVSYEDSPFELLHTERWNQEFKKESERSLDSLKQHSFFKLSECKKLTTQIVYEDQGVKKSRLCEVFFLGNVVDTEHDLVFIQSVRRFKTLESGEKKTTEDRGYALNHFAIMDVEAECLLQCFSLYSIYPYNVKVFDLENEEVFIFHGDYPDCRKDGFKYVPYEQPGDCPVLELAESYYRTEYERDLLNRQQNIRHFSLSERRGLLDSSIYDCFQNFHIARDRGDVIACRKMFQKAIQKSEELTQKLKDLEKKTLPQNEEHLEKQKEGLMDALSQADYS